jgi:alpha-tubulin suppressor-like RCC1 family protein
MNAQCFQKFSSSSSHSIVIKDDGTLWAWGKNSESEVGVCNGSLPVFGPTQLSNQPVWTKVFTGSNKTFAIKNDGTLWACGNGSGGSLGTGNQNDVCTLTQIGTDADWNEIYSGSGTIAKKNNGTLWGWGYNESMIFGSGGNVLQPIQLGTGNDWSKISGTNLGVVLTKQNGTLWYYSSSGFQQIGIDTNWVNIYGGFAHFFASKSDGTHWGYGSNQDGQLGLGSAITTTSVMTLFNCLAFLNVEEINPLVNLMIYPNPTNDFVFIENNSHKNIDKIY